MVVELNPENYQKGLYESDLGFLEQLREKGKVRDKYYVQDPQTQEKQLIFVTTDRLSAYDRPICTIPGKGRSLNLTSHFWADQFKGIIPIDEIAIPHDYVKIAKQAEATLPVEVVLRSHMAISKTSTSIAFNYYDLGRRSIYGYEFPEKLQPYKKFPPDLGELGVIITPTTKAENDSNGNPQHDEELTLIDAKEMVNGKFGEGIWEEVERISLELYKRVSWELHIRNLILADTKLEFGLDNQGKLMLIDELFTADSSRLWKMNSYDERLAKGKAPENFDKEGVRKYLSDLGYTGEGMPPTIPEEVLEENASVYLIACRMSTYLPILPETKTSDELNSEIKEAVLSYLEK